MGGDELKTAAPAADRRGAEQAAAGSEAWLRAVLDASPVPIALNDAHGNITYLTPSFTHTFGYELADIPTLREWWPQAYPDPAYREWVATEWRRRIEQVRREGTPFEPHEVIIRCKDGSLRTVIAGAALLVGAYEGTDMVTLQDITERKAAEEAIRAANLRLADADRRKDEFLAVLSHELRNPLTPIRSSLEVLEHPAASDEQRRRAFAVIGRQVTHLARLVDDLLDVSRITQSKIRLQRARLDLVDAVRARSRTTGRRSSCARWWRRCPTGRSGSRPTRRAWPRSSAT